MKKINLLFTVLVGSVCVLQSCDRDDDEDFQMSNQQFVIQASSSNNLEIAAGQMATERSQSEAVKTYGQHMVTSHTMAESELAALAAEKGLGMPQSFLSHHFNNLTLLNKSTQEQFDLLFAELMVVSHEEAVALYSRAAQPNGVPDPELRNWAQNELSALQEHLEEAEELYSSLTQPAEL